MTPLCQRLAVCIMGNCAICRKPECPPTFVGQTHYDASWGGRKDELKKVELRYEDCTCGNCGYKFKMPALEQFPKDSLGTFDLASWGFCTVNCLSMPALYMEPYELTLLERIKRPFFRFMEKRRMTNYLQKLRLIEKKEGM